MEREREREIYVFGDEFVYVGGEITSDGTDGIYYGIHHSGVISGYIQVVHSKGTVVGTFGGKAQDQHRNAHGSVTTGISGQNSKDTWNYVR